jgi:hypothetical protein
MPSASLKAFEDAQKNLSKQRELLDEAAVFIDEALKARLLVKYVDYPNISTWIDETSNNSVLTKLENLDFDKYASNLDEDLLDLDFKSALNEDAELVGEWEILHDAEKPKLRKSLDALEALDRIRKNSKLSDLNITDQMLGAIEGIPNVGYAQILDDLDAAIKALPEGKTVDFYKVVSDGNRGLVNANNVWDRRHSWLTLKKIKENETFLTNADEVRFEVELERINGVNHAVPDIYVTKSDNGIARIIIGEVKAGDNVITSNFNSQCTRYFNEITDIRNLRLFRRDEVTLTKQQVIDAWKNGGLLDNPVVEGLFYKFDNDVVQSGFDPDIDLLEDYLKNNNDWFNTIFETSF